LPRWIRAATGVVGASLLPLLFVFGSVVPRSEAKLGVPSPDAYGYTVPMWLEAQRALANGHGLLWSEYQNAGQRLLELPSSGLLYPPAWLILIWDLPTVFEWWVAFHLALAGGAAWWLARSIGQSRPAACVTAVAVQVASPALFLSLWGIKILATFSLMPLALFACERLLQRPGPRTCFALAGALTLQCLAGFPQVLAFTCELVGLRMLWEVATNPGFRTARSLGWAASAPGLFLLLSAVQIVPALSIFQESVRSIPLSAELIDKGSAEVAFDELRRVIGARGWQGGIFGLVCVLAGMSLAVPAFRRVTAFYALGASLFLLLVADSPVRDLYQALPVVGSLRGSTRFAWVASFCLCVLSGFAADALTGPGSRARLVRVLAGALLGALGFQVIANPGWSWLDGGGVAAVLALGAVAARVSSGSVATAVVLIVGIGLTAEEGVRTAQLRFMPNLEDLYTAREPFEAVQRRQSNQHRIVIFPTRRSIGGDLGVMEKSPSLYEIRSISDYEHLTTLPYATVYSYLTSNAMLEDAGDWIESLGEGPANVPLLNLLAGRFVLTGHGIIDTFKKMTPVGSTRSTYRLFENPNAVPRAHFAPRGEVVEEGAALMARLASPFHDPQQTVLLSAMPADGWLGDGPVNRGRRAYVGIRSSLGERVILSVDTPVPGFVVLTDQFDRGWSVTVDGEPAELLRANYAFRAVRVPAGQSRVAFTYHPRALVLGAVISGGALVACGLWALGARQRRRAINSRRRGSFAP